MDLSNKPMLDSNHDTSLQVAEDILATAVLPVLLEVCPKLVT